jgi:hypothetical protein
VQGAVIASGNLPRALEQSYLPNAISRSTRPRPLTGRRFLELRGPLAPTSIEAGNDDYCRQPSVDEAGAVLWRAISVPILGRAFRLSLRRIGGCLEKMVNRSI